MEGSILAKVACDENLATLKPHTDAQTTQTWPTKLSNLPLFNRKKKALLPVSTEAKDFEPSTAPPPVQTADSVHSRPGVSDEVEDLVAVTSYEYERYQRGVKIEKHLWQAFMLDPLERNFARSEPPSHWKPFTHPEGALYFHNTSWEIPVATDVYVYDSLLKERLEKYMHEILSYVRKYEITLPPDICLVLEFRLSGRCGYYFVDHQTQSLFWLDDFDAIVFLGQVRVLYTPPLVGHEVRALYWLHNSNFPDLPRITEDNISELKDLLRHVIGDSLTSSSSTTPFDLDTLERMLALVKDIAGDFGFLNYVAKLPNMIPADKPFRPGSATVIYRFLYLFHHERFLHLYGEQAARLNADQSIHPEREKSWLITILSPALLYGPDVHLQQLKEASVDSLVARRRWIALLQQLNDEWKSFTLYATVLLNANVAFLAIQSVDNSAPRHGHSSMQRASYFSIMNNLGSILLGLLLVWQHDDRARSDSTFLANRSDSGIGLETLALMYSLPYALLMWGFVSFLVAFLLMCFHSPDNTTVILIAISGVILLLLLLWTASFSVRGSDYSGVLSFFAKPRGTMAGVGRLRGKQD